MSNFNPFNGLSRRKIRLLFLIIAGLAVAPGNSKANENHEAVFSREHLVEAGYGFFDQVSGNVAGAIETVIANYGKPNGYIIGTEASGAFIGGLTYGEGTIYTATSENEDGNPIFWRGPSIGYDAGANGVRSMMLLYNLKDEVDVYRRFPGISGAAYLVGGMSINVHAVSDMLIVVVRSGVGARLGANIGYLKFSPEKGINPF